MVKLKRRFWMVALLVLLAGCAGADTQGNGDSGLAAGSEEQSAFGVFLEEQFREGVQADTITLHYTLAHPEDFGLSVGEPTFGEYSEAAYQAEMERAKGALRELETFDYESLREEEQLCYDILQDSLEVDVAGAPFFLYQEVLSPTTGLQAQLPVLLAEYKFYDEGDVKEYLALLPRVKEYFGEILEVEKLRAEAGLFLPDRAVEGILDQCRDFVREPEENFLISTFEGRLESLAGLNEDDRLAYTYENRRVVLEYVIPAYQEVVEVLESLKGSAGNDLGLYYQPEGQAYYQWLVRRGTASDWSLEEMKDRLEQLVQESIGALAGAYKESPEVLEQAASPPWPETEPKRILTYLRKAARVEYPVMADTSYSVKYVDPSLQDHLSPAFFLTPALDDWSNLAIYINESETNGSLDNLFTTLAHEGFPGHLYESVRFNQSAPAAIRQILSFRGYSEGWATYAEYGAYEYAGFSESLTTFLRANDLAVLAVCGRVDIGIHYEGWDLADTYEYLAAYGLATSEADAEGLYWSCIGEPAGTLDYVIGYLEFMDLREQAEQQWGEEKPEETFPVKEYHTALLDLGPAPFSVLEQWMGKIRGKK